VFHVDAKDLFGDLYFSSLLAGITDAASDRAAGVMLWLKTASPDEMIRKVLGVGLIDGVIVTANFRDDPVVDGLLSSNLPTVLVGHGGHSDQASYVDIDDVAASAQVVSYLLDLGLGRLGTITGPLRSVAGFDRLEGYRRTLARVGRDYDPELVVEGNFNYVTGREGAEKLLDRGVDGIFAANDEMAHGALDVIVERGLRVPEDVALAGFDDVEFAAHLDPPLTTVRQPVRRMGEIATATLLELIEDGDGGRRRVILPTEMVIRGSTEGTTEP
jgi:DNA-binding LacI/PurR family transcriptional regulator